MKYDIENITEDNTTLDEYSVMMGMEVFTVTVDGERTYRVYDDKGNPIDAPELIKAVTVYKEKENE